ncbi:MAG: hypothetical protein U0361_15925 [Nitrospiraceae bacterium]
MRLSLGLIAGILLVAAPSAEADELPLTHNVPIPEFQNRTENTKPYSFDAPPQGMFRKIVVAEGFDEELGIRRTHEIVPVRPTEQFPAGAKPVFIVFELHQHYQSFQIFGRCYPEQVVGLLPGTVVAEDAMYIALEDESGYLKLFPPRTAGAPADTKSKSTPASR